MNTKEFDQQAYKLIQTNTPKFDYRAQFSDEVWAVAEVILDRLNSSEWSSSEIEIANVAACLTEFQEHVLGEAKEAGLRSAPMPEEAE